MEKHRDARRLEDPSDLGQTQERIVDQVDDADRQDHVKGSILEGKTLIQVQFQDLGLLVRAQLRAGGSEHSRRGIASRDAHSGGSSSSGEVAGPTSGVKKATISGTLDRSQLLEELYDEACSLSRAVRVPGEPAVKSPGQPLEHWSHP
jgi:hypothetical protein